MSRRWTCCVGLSIIAVAQLALSGCAIETQTHFIPVETPQRAELFNLYVIDLVAGFKTRFDDRLIVDVSLINPDIDTTMVYSIPRLVIDSICFDAPRPGSPYCAIAEQKLDYSKLKPFVLWQADPYDRQIRSDLTYGAAGWSVQGFSFNCNDWLRSCSGEQVTALVYARSLDRRTGLVLKSAVEKVRYFVKVKTRLRGAGDF